MPPIEHVIVLALENRSFDHMLGFMDHPDPSFDGLSRGGPYTNPGWDGAPPVEATASAKPVLPVDPDHSHDAVMEQLAVQGTGASRRATNQGFVTSYERKGRGLAPPAFGGLLAPLIGLYGKQTQTGSPPIENRGPLAMRCQASAHVPVLTKLALEFGVCTRWFCSVPGETWPNRNFMHAATSDGDTNIETRFYTNPTIFELLGRQGKTWHIYHDDTPQVWAFVNLWSTPEQKANWFEFSAFADHVKAGSLPAYSFIEPNHRPPLHTLDHAPVVGQPDVGNSQHPGNNLVSNDAYDGYVTGPSTDFSRAELLVATVYEALRGNPDLFERSILLITYDEHGGLFDHVPPPVDVPNPGTAPTWFSSLIKFLYYRKATTFDFTMLGPRVPAVVVSPYVKAATVSTDVRDHASIPATLRKLFAPDAKPLTPRDAWAKPFDTLLTLDQPRRADLPDLSAVIAAAPAPAVAAPAPAPAAPAAPAPAAPAAPVAAAPARVPNHYDDFVALAEQVRAKLATEGVAQAQIPVATTAQAIAEQVTQVFMLVADEARGGGSQP